ncbi:hypothetical protein [Roseibium sp.]|uniref:hypothetical protein n=1 Tax=Roseibium sp. TaxID=1936156 RepID=UPI003D10401B
MQRLEDLEAVKDLRALEDTLPDHYTAQHRIEWMTRRLPASGGKTPIDLAFEGRTGELTARVKTLKKPIWRRALGALFG